MSSLFRSGGAEETPGRSSGRPRSVTGHLPRESDPLEEKFLASITQVIRSGRFVLGPEVQQLENRIARLCDVPHAAGCASGSDALLLALMAIGIEKWRRGDLPELHFLRNRQRRLATGSDSCLSSILIPSRFNIDPAAVKAGGYFQEQRPSFPYTCLANRPTCRRLDMKLQSQLQTSSYHRGCCPGHRRLG